MLTETTPMLLKKAGLRPNSRSRVCRSLGGRWHPGPRAFKVSTTFCTHPHAVLVCDLCTGPVNTISKTSIVLLFVLYRVSYPVAIWIEGGQKNGFAWPPPTQTPDPLESHSCADNLQT